MAVAKEPEVGSEILTFSATASSTLFDIDRINEMKLKDVVDEQEHLMLLVRHDVILREGGNHVPKKYMKNSSANKKN